MSGRGGPPARNAKDCVDKGGRAAATHEARVEKAARDGRQRGAQVDGAAGHERNHARAARRGAGRRNELRLRAGEGKVGAVERLVLDGLVEADNNDGQVACGGRGGRGREAVRQGAGHVAAERKGRGEARGGKGVGNGGGRAAARDACVVDAAVDPGARVRKGPDDGHGERGRAVERQQLARVREEHEALARRVTRERNVVS